jgi:8-oxo-dGTP pyrophosphatase MutT (NUDIX family)
MLSDTGRKLLDKITAYEPFNEQEERDRELILHALLTEEDVFTRDNALCHMTASAWIVNADRTKALMAYHNIYDSWSWLGGHADGEEDLLAVALKEAREEAGILNVRPVSDEILSLEVLTVDGHVKRGRYVSSHLHLNVTYLAVAEPDEAIRIKPDENSGVRWAALEDAIRLSTEPWIRERIYRKLNEKLRARFA